MRTWKSSRIRYDSGADVAARSLMSGVSHPSGGLRSVRRRSAISASSPSGPANDCKAAMRCAHRRPGSLSRSSRDVHAHGASRSVTQPGEQRRLSEPCRGAQQGDRRGRRLRHATMQAFSSHVAGAGHRWQELRREQHDAWTSRRPLLTHLDEASGEQPGSRQYRAVGCAELTQWRVIPAHPFDVTFDPTDRIEECATTGPSSPMTSSPSRKHGSSPPDGADADERRGAEALHRAAVSRLGLCRALGRIRTCAHGSGGRCSIP